jgi:hypothetical protein
MQRGEQSMEGGTVCIVSLMELVTQRRWLCAHRAVSAAALVMCASSCCNGVRPVVLV